MITPELRRFLVVGICAVAVDHTVYSELVAAHALSMPGGKAAGFVTGTAFAFMANRKWTFRSNQRISKEVLRFMSLYASTLVANVSINSLIMQILGSATHATEVAFAIATVSSASLNYLGMRHFVFRPGETYANS